MEFHGTYQAQIGVGCFYVVVYSLFDEDVIERFPNYSCSIDHLRESRIQSAVH